MREFAGSFARQQPEWDAINELRWRKAELSSLRCRNTSQADVAEAASQIDDQVVKAFVTDFDDGLDRRSQ